MREHLREKRREYASVKQSAYTAGIGLILALCTWCIPAQAGPATVLSIGDGDTLTVSDTGRKVTVRLACIDAPESAQTPYGGKARATLQALAPIGTTVTIQGSKKDRYGRTVAEVFRGSTNVNLDLVRRGDAFVYHQFLAGCDRNAYLGAEMQAEGARLGVWSVPGGVVRPWVWRRGGTARQYSVPYSSGIPTVRYRCRDIGSWAKAQDLLKQGHMYLDKDDDGEACENLR